MTLRSATTKRAAQTETVVPTPPPQPPPPAAATSTSPDSPQTSPDSDSESSDDDDIFPTPPDGSATPLDPTTAAVAALLARPDVPPAEMQLVMLQARQVKSSLTTRTALAASDLSTVRNELAQTLLAGLATATRRDRQSLWTRYTNFLEDKGLEISDVTAALFVTATGVSLQARLTYAKTLSAIFGKLNRRRDVLSEYMTGLRKQGAAMPKHQAPPIKREHLLAVAASFPPKDQAAILLAWKTASRWSDIVGISTDNIIRREQDEIIIFWSNNTKTTHEHQYYPSCYAVVQGDLTDTIARHLRTTPSKPLTTITRRVLVQRMQELFPSEQYTAHSIKRGAIHALTAQGAPMKDIARLAKHKTPQDEVSATTIRYCSTGKGAWDAARLLGTQNATVLL